VTTPSVDEEFEEIKPERAEQVNLDFSGVVEIDVYARDAYAVQADLTRRGGDRDDPPRARKLSATNY
jgi:hypothetical protein